MTYSHLVLIISLQFIKVYCIPNGRNAGDYAFPSIVLVKFNESIYCGGSIIYPDYVLTSGVCGYNRKMMHGVTATYLDISRNGTGAIIPVQSMTIHPEFQMGIMTTIHDLAILKLTIDLQYKGFLRPVPIHNSPVIIGQKCQTAGWGLVSDKFMPDDDNNVVDVPWKSPSSVLKSCPQIIVDISKCSSLINDSRIKLSANQHICARGGEKKQGPSIGDFGGPLICNGKQAGISSHSLWDENTKYLYTVYTPLYHHRKWISTVTGKDFDLIGIAKMIRQYTENQTVIEVVANFQTHFTPNNLVIMIYLSLSLLLNQFVVGC